MGRFMKKSTVRISGASTFSINKWQIKSHDTDIYIGLSLKLL
jgi:hypothetical protein